MPAGWFSAGWRLGGFGWGCRLGGSAAPAGCWNPELRAATATATAPPPRRHRDRAAALLTGRFAPRSQYRGSSLSLGTALS